MSLMGVLMRMTRRGLQIGLGVIWLLDGALQLQPVMFTKDFATQIIAPAGAGQPGFVHSVVSLGATVIGSHPVPFGVLFAVVQLAIGFGLLWRRTSRPALAASIAWAVGVWVTGEGLGGLFGSGSSMLTGAPGAAILYAVLAVAAWPRRDGQAEPARWLRPAWAVVWAGFAVLQLLPGRISGGAVSASLTGSLDSVPGPLTSASRGIASVAAGHGVAASVLLAAAFAGIAVAALLPRPGPAAAATIGAMVALAAWLLAQGLGGIGTGQATDPDTGPLLVLFAVAMWSAVPRRHAAVAALRTAPEGERQLAPADEIRRAA
jgi:hypothetical protein